LVLRLELIHELSDLWVVGAVHVNEHGDTVEDTRDAALPDEGEQVVVGQGGHQITELDVVCTGRRLSFEFDLSN